MDDIGTMNDDSSGGLSFRPPSRAERAIDDPIREMEGMLVDEYGRLATYFHPCSCEILLAMNHTKKLLWFVWLSWMSG